MAKKRIRFTSPKRLMKRQINQFINGNKWIVVRGIKTEAKSHAMFLVPEFIEKLERLK
ncbi:hypothetical protein H5778_27170 [Klebsiella pneumoniae]|nr:hypothetical protein [Klebsiella pneumoniae]